ncbi:TorD/DmsD family molecular chaperone [Paenibacillus kandeliae]|uniref:TorD/DmsD family molecular chaperone n=1 Tax=Paenibacillus kandeliae TaxID=3231269 RepID=UPI0034582586
MTVNAEVKTHTDWLYSRVMTYRLLSEMLQRKPTLSKLIEWRREAGRVLQLSARPHTLLLTLDDTPLANIIQDANQQCCVYEQLIEQHGLPLGIRAAQYVRAGQEPCEYEAMLNSVYSRAGITFKKTAQETDDHIGIELEFMSLLAERLAESEGNTLEQINVIQAQLDFMEHYLQPWVPALCQQLQQQATHSLYGQWADMVLAYLEQDQEDLRHYAAELRYAQ